MYQASVCGDILTAGRYGDARIKSISTNRARWLLHKCCFLWPGSDRSFALTVQWPPHTPNLPGRR